MNPYLQQRTVLVLNRHWVAVDAITPAEAFCHLSAGSARALDVDAELRLEPLPWSDWRDLPPVPGQPTVGTSRGPVRLPTVIVLRDFSGIPLLQPHIGLHSLWRRDGGRCQYTGRTLTPGEGDIDHILPRSRGGLTTWENCVLADRAINRRKGARTPDEAGLRLLRPPRKPQAAPFIATFQNHQRIPAWEHFLPPSANSKLSI